MMWIPGRHLYGGTEFGQGEVGIAVYTDVGGEAEFSFMPLARRGFPKSGGMYLFH